MISQCRFAPPWIRQYRRPHFVLKLCRMYTPVAITLWKNKPYTLRDTETPFHVIGRPIVNIRTNQLRHMQMHELITNAA